jgi:hypothetical protein
MYLTVSKKKKKLAHFAETTNSRIECTFYDIYC